MNLSKLIALQLNAVYFGGNWTSSNLKEHLTGLTWQQATTQVQNFNSIAVLTYHATYYVGVLIEVLQGKPLIAKDEYSFNIPQITSQPDWEKLLNKVWKDAELAIQLIEQLPDEKLTENFADEKYGTYYRNLNGVIEHLHYHLGQIVLIKKILSCK